MQSTRQGEICRGQPTRSHHHDQESSS